MIKRNSLLAFFCTFIVFSITCPSVAYTTFPSDSIRVKWMDGKKHILHKVEAKETWMTLSRRYNCTVSDLKVANEGVEVLKLGQIINIPAEGMTAESAIPVSKTVSTPAPHSTKGIAPGKENTVPAVVATTTKTPVFYTVRKGETIYSISKKHNQTIQQVKTINKLSSDVVSEGQLLIVGYMNPGQAPAVAETAMPVPASSLKDEKQVTLTPNVKAAPTVTAAAPATQATPKAPPATAPKTGISPAAGYDKPVKSISPIKKGSSGKAQMQVTETGVAAWIQDAQVNPDKYYALHRSAPIGTIIKVIHRMNNQFVYVKVVGSLPDTGENENIIIKVSQAVSSKLNALDPLFQVELSYGLLQ